MSTGVRVFHRFHIRCPLVLFIAHFKEKAPPPVQILWGLPSGSKKDGRVDLPPFLIPGPCPGETRHGRTRRHTSLHLIDLDRHSPPEKPILAWYVVGGSGPAS